MGSLLPTMELAHTDGGAVSELNLKGCWGDLWSQGLRPLRAVGNNSTGPSSLISFLLDRSLPCDPGCGIHFSMPQFPLNSTHRPAPRSVW